MSAFGRRAPKQGSPPEGSEPAAPHSPSTVPKLLPKAPKVIGQRQQGLGEFFTSGARAKGDAGEASIAGPKGGVAIIPSTLSQWDKKWEEGTGSLQCEAQDRKRSKFNGAHPVAGEGDGREEPAEARPHRGSSADGSADAAGSAEREAERQPAAEEGAWSEEEEEEEGVTHKATHKAEMRRQGSDPMELAEEEEGGAVASRAAGSESPLAGACSEEDDEEVEEGWTNVNVYPNSRRSDGGGAGARATAGAGRSDGGGAGARATAGPAPGPAPVTGEATSQAEAGHAQPPRTIRGMFTNPSPAAAGKAKGSISSFFGASSSSSSAGPTLPNKAPSAFFGAAPAAASAPPTPLLNKVPSATSAAAPTPLLKQHPPASSAFCRAAFTGGASSSAAHPSNTPPADLPPPHVPLPPEYQDAWDNANVKLPCSPRHEALFGKRWWDVINAALAPPGKLRDFATLRVAIRKCMSTAKKQAGWGFGGSGEWFFKQLQALLEDDFDAEERESFFGTTLPGMVKLALMLPSVCPTPIPLLRQNHGPGSVQQEVLLDSLQIASLLANAFFCTFPDGPDSFPGINFWGLFEMPYDPKRSPANRQKLRCIIHYFSRQTLRLEAEGEAALTNRFVSFHRRGITRDARAWFGSVTPLGFAEVAVQADGTIEDSNPPGEPWQADFANKYIGGGVISNGCVQEEIRLAISPEGIISRALAEVLLGEDSGISETLLIVGSERFCNYTGYAAGFKFAGDHQDTVAEDETGRRLTTLTAFDAIHFGYNQYRNQFRAGLVVREANKALCAFRPLTPSDGDRAVATGNWGCGAFGGDAVLKFLIQWMAAAEAGRRLDYFTFKDAQLSARIQLLHRELLAANTTVGQLMHLLGEFKPGQYVKGPIGGGEQLQNFVLHRVSRQH